MSNKSSQILTSPAFLLSLSLLLLNDFTLKSNFPGLITGKLSDFAGLFAFTLFWMALFPKWGRTVAVAIAAAFTFWKSSYSQPIIDSWNRLQIGSISRTVDLTDLIALSIVPLAYWYGIRERQFHQVPRWSVALVTMISVFAFTATSPSIKTFDYHQQYYFQGSKGELFKKIDELHLQYFDFPLSPEEKKSERLVLQIPSSSICRRYFSATFHVSEKLGQTIVSLEKLEHPCPERTGERDRLLQEFEKEFIERLRTGTPQTKHYKSDRTN